MTLVSKIYVIIVDQILYVTFLDKKHLIMVLFIKVTHEYFRSTSGEDDIKPELGRKTD